MKERVPFNELPCELKNRLIERRRCWLANHESPEGSEWIFRIVPLDDLYLIGGTPPEGWDEDEDKVIKRYKNEYLKRCCNTPLILSKNMEYLIDGYHHLAAFREAVEEDDTLPKKIECWERLDS